MKPPTRACHQLKDFVAKMVGFENRIAEYIKAYLRNGSAENRHLQSKSRSLITRPRMAHLMSKGKH